MNMIPIESLVTTAEARKALAEADVIIGVDISTQRAFTVFGTPDFEESIQIGLGGALRTVRVSLGEQAGGLERLVALVQAIKGRNDYLAGDE